MTSSQTLRRQQRDVEEFRDKVSHLLDALTYEHRSFGGDVTWIPKDGLEDEAALRALEVDRVAGRAAVALMHVGQLVAWKPPGMPPGYSKTVNPAQAWRTILEDYPIMDTSIIFSCCEQAIGMLDAQASEAKEHEESLTGKVEKVTGFWRRIRGDRARGVPSQYGAVILGAVLGLPVALLAAYLAYAFGWVGS